MKVSLRAKKSEIIELNENHLKIKLVSPPERNRANQELINMLAEYYKIKKSAIKIKKGKYFREKLIEISNSSDI
ncbi:MAG: DUF167 domain-containing protein [candidate division WOR-3 bacterium]|nr:MAG: DUF167 domain-containing protein [candidate division WOR-3 bacterium]